MSSSHGSWEREKWLASLVPVLFAGDKAFLGPCQNLCWLRRKIRLEWRRQNKPAMATIRKRGANVTTVWQRGGLGSWDIWGALSLTRSHIHLVYTQRLLRILSFRKQSTKENISIYYIATAMVPTSRKQHQDNNQFGKSSRFFRHKTPSTSLKYLSMKSSLGSISWKTPAFSTK